MADSLSPPPVHLDGTRTRPCMSKEVSADTVTLPSAADPADVAQVGEGAIPLSRLLDPSGFPTPNFSTLDFARWHGLSTVAAWMVLYRAWRARMVVPSGSRNSMRGARWIATSCVVPRRDLPWKSFAEAAK